MAPEMLRSVISAASETAVTSLLGGLILCWSCFAQHARFVYCAQRLFFCGFSSRRRGSAWTCPSGEGRGLGRLL